MRWKSASPTPSAWAPTEPCRASPFCVPFPTKRFPARTHRGDPMHHNDTLAMRATRWRAPFSGGATPQAQDFPPKKPVTLVVGFAAGGAADAAARLIAKKLGENIGQTVVVDNKGGAGGNIAHQFVAKGAGRWLGAAVRLGRAADHCAAPDEAALRPVQGPGAHVGRRELPQRAGGAQGPGREDAGRVRAAGQEEARQRGLCSTGAGSASHLAGELFNQRAGIDMVHVPYKGGAPACRTCWASASPYFPRRPRPCRMSRAASWFRWPPPA
jgi:hypothetical protein